MMASAIDSAAEELSAVFVDVDQFKQVNDCYSHAVGDEVLRRIAVILRTQCRSEDVPVRYGGDEFLILVFGGGTAAEGVAERLHEAVRSRPLGTGRGWPPGYGRGRRGPLSPGPWGDRRR